MSIITHEVSADLQPAPRPARRRIGHHYFILYEPNVFSSQWRVVKFRAAMLYNPVRKKRDAYVVKMAEWMYDADPREVTEGVPV